MVEQKTKCTAYEVFGVFGYNLKFTGQLYHSP